MPGVILEIDPTSEDSSNVSLVLVDNVTYFLLGEDWPEAEVDLSTASSISTEGEVPITAKHHNTTGTFQLRVVGSTAAALQTALNYIDKKLAKIMREGGTLKRTTPSGSTYVTDLLQGQLNVLFSRRYTASNKCDVTITLGRRPYWRGAAVTLGSNSETTLPCLRFTVGGPAGADWVTTATALTPSLWWRHGEPSGTTANDNSGNGRTGTYGAGITVNQTGLIAGDTNKAITGDGTSTSTVTSSYNPFTGNLTICGWANVTSLAATRNLWGGTGSANAPLLQIQATSGDVTWFSDLGAATQTWSAAWSGLAGSIVFWVMTWNNSTKVSELFINNVSKGTKTSANAFNASPGTFTLNGSNAANGNLGTFDETLIFAGTILNTTQIGNLYNAGAGLNSALTGDVPALGRLVITEAQAQDQFWLTHGIRSRYYSSSADAALFYEAETRTPQGAGAATAVGPSGASGGGSNTILANNLASTYQSILSTQASGGGNHLAHVGDFQVYARVQVPSANTGFVTTCLEWSQGDFVRTTRNGDVTVYPAGNTGTTFNPWGGTWRFLNLGQVSLQKVAQGTQRWEGRILAKSTVAGDDIYVDHLVLVPVTEGSGVVSGKPAASAGSSFSGRDEFDQTAGVLVGKTAPTGGVWAGGGDTDDFSVETSGHTATRNVASDTGVGRVDWVPTSMTNCVVQADVKFADPGSGSPLSQTLGVAARVVDASNFAYAGLFWTLTTSAFVVAKVIAGTATILISKFVPRTFGAFYTVKMLVDSAGRVWAGYATQGQTITYGYVGQDAALATGTLASGFPGIYDFEPSAANAVRNIDNFAAWVPPLDAAVFASRQAEIRNDRIIRQDSGGTIWASPSSFQGDYLLIPPSGREGRKTEIIVKACRNDPATMADTAIDDITAQLIYTPRFLTLPE